MKTVYIDFKDKWALSTGDYNEEGFWYVYKYNRVGIENVKEVIYENDVLTVEYKPTKKAKKILIKRFQTVAIKNMTIN